MNPLHLTLLFTSFLSLVMIGYIVSIVMILERDPTAKLLPGVCLVALIATIAFANDLYSRMI